VKKTPYVPKGKAAVMVAEVEKDLTREFTSREASQIMQCDIRAVGASLEYATRNGLIFRRSNGKHCWWRGQPYRDSQVRGQPESPNETRVRIGTLSSVQPRAGWVTSADDVRYQKVVPGWTPPKMVCVRGA
jgi:hypothetical protein